MILSIVEENPSVPATDFLQSKFWADFKCKFGWSSLLLRVQCECGSVFEISLLIRKLAGPFTFAYVPHGPEVGCTPEARQKILLELAAALKKRLPVFCVFLRFDPAWYLANQDITKPDRPVFSFPLIKGSDVQPPDTVVLDLSSSVDELLARMKPKWRYNIKLAEKKSVVITEETSSELDVFYDLYQQTAVRDRIAVHPKNYYTELFDLAASYADSKYTREEPSPDVRLWVARHEGQAVACIVTLFYGRTATYLYGASSDEKRNLMPAYALQWAAINAAKAAGCLEYDMYGIPPTQDEQHPMAGLYRFKTGFGGEIRHYSGSWDYVYQPLSYSMFRAAERLRLLWHKKIRKLRL